MQEIAPCRQQAIIGGDFSLGSFLRGAACGGALVAGAAGGPPGVIAAITACSLLMYDEAM